MTVHTRTDSSSPAPTSSALSEAAALPSSATLIGQLDALRFAAGEADVLAAVTVEWFDRRDWHDTDPEQVERLAHLLGLIARASSAVVTAIARFHGALADVQPAHERDSWNSEDSAR